MSSPSLRICVVGAGAAGLCAARRAVEQLPGAEVSILEQSDQLGGTWVYTEQQQQGGQPTHSSMYAELRTNIPKEIMNFCDFPIESVDFSDHQNSDDSFPRHEVILSYLKRFAEPIKHLIKFNLRVLSIVPFEGDKISHLKIPCQANDNFGTKWRIVSEETTSKKRTFVEYFDVVFVCTGHYWCPRIPTFANKLKIRWAHSHSYRRAEQFAGMHVAVVGANLSGVEIALQLAEHAEKVYLINSSENAALGGVNAAPNSNVLIELNGSRVTDAEAASLVLADGRVVGQLHFVLFCTGYHFSFPFFNQQMNSAVVRCDGNFVSPLIGHVVHPNFLNSLFFIGLNLFVVPFPCFDIQVNINQKRFTMEMAKHWEDKRIQQLEAEQMPQKHFHRLGPDQWKYFEWLNSLSGFKPLPEVIENIYKFNLEQKRKNPRTYRNIRYQIVDEQTFTTNC
ncbi:hypothetical protein niasHS_014854 [Heterodera schachtii]|uniref:Flavin-containing monooxygenase n=1 Tax=Heterodera schachtii TaxID=97005 RepID=A0ABD2IFU2_HETSC